MTKYSLNNRLVLELYVTDKSLRSTVKSGMAFVSQKNNLVGLTVLMGATLADGREIVPGSKAYIKESTLHTAPWAKDALLCDTISDPFIIVDLTFVDFITGPAEPAA